MPKATLTLEIPDDIWIGELTRENPELRLQVLSAIPSGAVGVALVELTAPEPSAVLEELRDDASVTDVETLELEGKRALVQLETRLPVLLDAARESGVPVATPFAIRDGEVTWEVTTSRERLSTLGTKLESFGVGFSVESVYQRIDSDRFLTDQQWEVLRTAIELGYYDTPRACTQYELAEALGIARSTCSETLHRAEERVIKEFVEAATEPAEPTLTV